MRTAQSHDTFTHNVMHQSNYPNFGGISRKISYRGVPIINTQRLVSSMWIWILLFVYLLTLAFLLHLSIYASVRRLQFHSSIARTNGELKAKWCTRINLFHLCLLLLYCDIQPHVVEHTLTLTRTPKKMFGARIQNIIILIIDEYEKYKSQVGNMRDIRKQWNTTTSLLLSAFNTNSNSKYSKHFAFKTLSWANHQNLYGVLWKLQQHCDQHSTESMWIFV